jgi:hypothetical protein
MDDAITLLFLFTATYKIKYNESKYKLQSSKQSTYQKPFNQ